VARQTPPRGLSIRRFTLGSGPLKRTSDRLELLSRVVLTAVLLIAVAIALAAATAMYDLGRTEMAAEAAERHQVSAQLQEDAVATAGSGDVGRASGVWTAPSGLERTGQVPAELGAEAGSSVVIWVDQGGDRTTRPTSAGDVVGRAVGSAVLTYLGITALAWGAHLGFRRLLDRGRSHRWAAEWAVVGPKWSGRVP
jgi:hypothetical protein